MMPELIKHLIQPPPGICLVASIKEDKMKLKTIIEKIWVVDDDTSELVFAATQLQDGAIGIEFTRAIHPDEFAQCAEAVKRIELLMSDFQPIDEIAEESCNSTVKQWIVDLVKTHEIDFFNRTAIRQRLSLGKSESAKAISELLDSGELVEHNMQKNGKSFRSLRIGFNA